MNKISFNPSDYGFTDEEIFNAEGWVLTSNFDSESDFFSSLEEAVKEGIYNIFMHHNDAFIDETEVYILAIKNNECISKKKININYGWAGI